MTPARRLSPIRVALFLLVNTVSVALAQPKPQLNMTLADPGPQGAASTTAWFAQVAIGGGYITVFTFLNTGIDNVSGTLTLTAQDGKPLSASLVASAALSANPSFSETGIAVVGDSAPVAVKSGGTQFITATAAGLGNQTQVGWARVESSGGTIGGVATFQLTPTGSALPSTIVGVLSSSPTPVATIPVNDDLSQGRTTGFAVANPSTTDSLKIRIVGVITDGFQAGTFGPVDLPPGNQIAKFFWQLDGFPSTFRGSAVLIEESGKPFAVVALVQARGQSGDLFTAIPVIQAKPPGIN